MTHYMVNRGMNRTPLCEDCDEQPGVPQVDPWGDPGGVALCEPCVERRWDRDQERRMEDGE